MSDSDSNYDRPCLDQETLVAYAYGECEPWERERVDAHLDTCASCAETLQSFWAVRGALGEWTVPDTRLGFRIVADTSAPLTDDPSRSWWPEAFAPAWSLALAATLVIVVAAAVASVELRYDESGFVFRMGWAAEAAADRTAPAEAPGRADLNALEQTLRAELVSSSSAPPDLVGSDGLRREMLALIQQSERRQQQEFASRLITLAQEFEPPAARRPIACTAGRGQSDGLRRACRGPLGPVG